MRFIAFKSAYLHAFFSGLPWVYLWDRLKLEHPFFEGFTKDMLHVGSYCRVQGLLPGCLGTVEVIQYNHSSGGMPQVHCKIE